MSWDASSWGLLRPYGTMRQTSRPAPPRKRCVVKGQMTKASNKGVRTPSPHLQALTKFHSSVARKTSYRSSRPYFSIAPSPSTSRMNCRRGSSEGMGNTTHTQVQVHDRNNHNITYGRACTSKQSTENMFRRCTSSGVPLAHPTAAACVANLHRGASRVRTPGNKSFTQTLRETTENLAWETSRRMLPAGL